MTLHAKRSENANCRFFERKHVAGRNRSGSVIKRLARCRQKDRLSSESPGDRACHANRAGIVLDDKNPSIKIRNSHTTKRLQGVNGADRRAKSLQSRKNFRTESAAGVQHGPVLQIGAANRRKASCDLLDYRIGNCNQNNGSDKETLRQIRTTAAASDGPDCAPRLGLSSRDNALNLPTMFAQTTAQCAANSSCADNGNCKFLHYARIPCWHLPTPIHEDYRAGLLRNYRIFLDCTWFARGAGRADTALAKRFHCSRGWRVPARDPFVRGAR